MNLIKEADRRDKLDGWSGVTRDYIELAGWPFSTVQHKAHFAERERVRMETVSGHDEEERASSKNTV